jgi:hypothetical protein
MKAGVVIIFIPSVEWAKYLACNARAVMLFTDETRRYCPSQYMLRSSSEKVVYSATNHQHS